MKENKKKILVLTSGGDSSGMNAYIKAMAKLCKKNNIELVGSMYGFLGLIKNDFVKLDYNQMRQVQNMGGSILKSSRCKEFQTEDGFKKAVENLNKAKFDCVVVVGGNGSLRGAYDLMNVGVNVIGVPATIDNDLAYTDLSLGYDTACQNAVCDIVKIKQSMSAFDRGFIAEVMGRNCSDIALKTAIISNADMCITEKVEFDEILKKVEVKTEKGVKSPLIIVQENLFDIDALARYLEHQTQREYRSVKLGYIQRGGEPSNVDKMYAIELAVLTIETLLNKVYGIALGKRDGQMIAENLANVLKQKTVQSNLKYIFDNYCFD